MRKRSWVPARLTGAINNSLSKWDDLFDLLLAHPDLWEPVRAENLLVKTEGRPRMAGEWALVYLAFINSAERELLRWYRVAPDELWQRAGFVQTPSYHAAYKNFAALEAHEAAFRQVAASFIQLAVEASDGKVGHAIHVDGTEAEAHSRLIHDCQGEELHKCGKQTLVPRRVTNADAREERHRLAAIAPTDHELTGAAEDLAADERGLRVKVGGCWYLLSDNEAGIRAYTKDGKVRKFWAGYYCAKAVDHYTGGVLAVHVTSASTQEHIAYPDLYAQLKTQLGHAPRAVVADRGYSVASVFELHTRDGVASVIPWRRSGTEKPTRTTCHASTVTASRTASTAVQKRPSTASSTTQARKPSRVCGSGAQSLRRPSARASSRCCARSTGGCSYRYGARALRTRCSRRRTITTRARTTAGGSATRSRATLRLIAPSVAASASSSSARRQRSSSSG